MDKNTLTGIILIFALVFLYMHFLAPSGEQPRSVVTNTVVRTDSASDTPANPPDARLEEGPVPPDEITTTDTPRPSRPESFAVISNELASFTFGSSGGSLYRIELARSPVVRKGPLATVNAPSNQWQVPFRLRSAGGLPVETTPFAFERSGARALTYTATVANTVFVRKSYSLNTNTYLLNGRIDIENVSDTTVALSNRFSVWLGQMGPVTLTRDRFAVRGADVQIIKSANGGMDIEREKASDDNEWNVIPGPDVWLAVRNKYFAHILIPDRPAAYTSIRSVGPEDARRITAYAGIDAPDLAPGDSFSWQADLYAGPKSYERLTALSTRIGRGTKYDEVLNLGWLSFLARPILVYGLKGLYRYVHNYGLAIIILTVLIKIVTWPLTSKSVMSMKQMQKLQPEMQKLKEKYKDDPKKQQQEMMLLYRKHGYNPLGGCLPMLLQIPIFIALYAALSGAIELWGASFLWINDLSMPDTVAKLPYIPFLGDKALGYTGLNPLPLAMCGAMIGQQALSPSAGDPSQQKMMYIMPVIFLFIFYKMPSGLTLYWLVNQLLTMVQMFYLHYIKK